MNISPPLEAAGLEPSTPPATADGQARVAEQIEQIRDTIKKPVHMEKHGLRTYAGVMEKITFTATIPEIAERLNFDRLFDRHHFDLESIQPGNRDIAELHWKEIEQFLVDDDRPFLGTLTVAMRRDQAELEPAIEGLGEHCDLMKLVIREGAEKPIVQDGQHRVLGAVAAWQSVRNVDPETGDPRLVEAKRLLARSSLTIEMLFEHQRDVLSTIFVRMGNTRKISEALKAVMDRSVSTNLLGAAVTRKSDLFRNRTSYLGAKAGKEIAEKHGREYEALYAANAVVNAAACMAGVGVKDRTPLQRQKNLDAIVEERRHRQQIGVDAAIDQIATEIAAALNYAYRHLPGWAEINRERLTVSDFKKLYVHGTAAGLYTVAIVLAAAREAGVDMQQTINVMSQAVPWRRDALRQNPDGTKVHDFFEDTLVKTELGKEGKWTAGTAGARRDLYVAAANKVLRAVAKAEPSLQPIAAHSTYVALGLSTSGQRGRPKKT